MEIFHISLHILITVNKVANKQNVLTFICDLLNKGRVIIIYKEMQF